MVHPQPLLWQGINVWCNGLCFWPGSLFLWATKKEHFVVTSAAWPPWPLGYSLDDIYAPHIDIFTAWWRFYWSLSQTLTWSNIYCSVLRAFSCIQTLCHNRSVSHQTTTLLHQSECFSCPMKTRHWPLKSSKSKFYNSMKWIPSKHNVSCSELSSMTCRPIKTSIIYTFQFYQRAKFSAELNQNTLTTKSAEFILLQQQSGSWVQQT